MAGGGGDAPPPPPPVNGGAFLLQLLKNPPQNSRSHSQPPPPQSLALPHDPAVAAVGPFPTPSFSAPHATSGPVRFPPHNYFNQGNQGLGFPQNPNPNFNNPNPNRAANSVHGSHQITDQSMLDYMSKLGLIHRNQQDRHDELVFGSMHSDFQTSKNGKLDYDPGKHLLRDRELGLNGSQVDLHRNAEFMRNTNVSSLAFGNYVSNYVSPESPSQQQVQQVRRMPPPGFSGSPVPIGKRNTQQSMGKGKGNNRDVENSGERLRNWGQSSGNNRDVENSGERSRNWGQSSGDRNQLNRQGPSSGVHIHRHMVVATDVEELHERNNGVDSVELDDLEEQVDKLLLEDGTDEKNDIRKGPKSRDKDYRSDKRGEWLLNQRMRDRRSHIECRGDINRLNAHFLTLYESLIPPEEEKEKQKQLMALLNKHVTSEWPGARLFLYGSCANSFGFSKSDIDVCLAMGDADVDKSEILLRLADILKSENLENVQALTHARVPIVKLMDPATGISCDICVNNLLAVINTKLLRDYSKIDVRLRQLAFIVKHWAKSRGVNETYQGTLSSYAYVLMCIHFLQQRTPSILPCLQGMEATYKVNVGNVECSYFDQVEKLQGFGSRNGESIAKLVWGFFQYWAYCHDYTNDVVSIRTGSLISKREKDWTRRIGNDRHLICIEDPFELSHDLGRVVDKRSIRVLREEFERAAEILQYDPNPCLSHDLGRVVDKRSIRVLREEFERAAEILQYDPNPCVKLFEPYIPC